MPLLGWSLFQQRLLEYPHQALGATTQAISGHSSLRYQRCGVWWVGSYLAASDQ